MRKLSGLALLVISINISSQNNKGATYKEHFSVGYTFFLKSNFSKALEKFQAAYNVDSSSANIKYLLGVCSLHSAFKKDDAVRYLAEAVKSISATYKSNDHTERFAPLITHFYYGRALHINYRFDEAAQQYNNYEKLVDAKDAKIKKALESARADLLYAREMVANAISIQIINMGDKINSPHSDYNPVLSSDEKMLIYTVQNPKTTDDLKTPTGLYNEDIVVSYKNDKGAWGSPQSLSKNINTNGSEASVNLSPDGQTLIIYKNDIDGGNIYYSTYNGTDWETLKEFGSDVNTKFNDSHACMSNDGNLLFVVSDRPGGFGGKDIYRFIKFPNGRWSKAFNLGPAINTEFDEDGAFLHPDGKTFYFTSKGYKTMGGSDIKFGTLTQENNIENVTNVSYPINTTDDDAVFFVTSPDAKRSYYSAVKEDGFGEKDIYMVSFSEAKEKPLSLFKGEIIAAKDETLPANLVVIVTDKETGEIIGNYRPKSANGSFSTILPPGREYNFSYVANGDEFYNEDVYVTKDHTYQEIKREVNLEPITISGKVKVDQKTILLNVIVFDDKKNKKLLPGAIIRITDQETVNDNYNSNMSGRCDGIVLMPEKKYKITVEAEGIMSSAAEISTKGIKAGKVMSHFLYVHPVLKIEKPHSTAGEK